MPRRIRVAIVEEHEILRCGLVACLLEEPFIPLSAPGDGELVKQEADVAVVSIEAARRYEFSCPVVVCSDEPAGAEVLANRNDLAGVVHPSSVTVGQLLACVRAAAAGLRVGPKVDAVAQDGLDPRSLRLLEFVADGLNTREIADRMSYSEQTIKKLIAALQGRMGARSRAHMVALAIRRRLI